MNITTNADETHLMYINGDLMLTSQADTAGLVTDSNEINVDCDIPTSFGFLVDNTNPIELTASGPPSRGAAILAHGESPMN